MSWRVQLAGAALALMVVAAGALAPVGVLAREASGSPATLKAQITKTYKWARVYVTPRTVDGKQFSLSLIITGKPVDLSEGIGANLLLMYITQLPNQPLYYMTAYSAVAQGAASWQYTYVPAIRQLVRMHFISARSLERTTWYITTAQIAQAAKVGHWPSPGAGQSH